MFDLGFSELMLVMIVALIVVGPERLPGLARKAGYWIGRFRRYVINVRSEIERELNADELRSMLSKQEDEIRELRDMLQDTREQIRSEVDDINQEVGAVGEQIRHGVGSDAAGGNTAIEHAPEATGGAATPPAAEAEHESHAEVSHEVAGGGVGRESHATVPSHEASPAEPTQPAHGAAGSAPRDDALGGEGTAAPAPRQNTDATVVGKQDGKPAPREATTHER